MKRLRAAATSAPETHRTHSQRNENGFQNGKNFCVEVSADGAYAEDQDEEVKSVKRPAHKTGNEGYSAGPL